MACVQKGEQRRRHNFLVLLLFLYKLTHQKYGVAYPAVTNPVEWRELFLW